MRQMPAWNRRIFDPATGENLTVDRDHAGRIPSTGEEAEQPALAGQEPQRRTGLRSTDTPPQIATPRTRTVGEVASSSAGTRVPGPE